MSQVAFIVDVPDYKASALADLPNVGVQLAQLVSKNLPKGQARFLVATTGDTPLRVDLITDVKNPTSTLTTLKKVSAAGGAAGSTAVTGAIATSVLLAVFASNDTTHAVTDVTAEWVANPPTSGHFDNTGGTDFTGSHVIWVFYNPLAVGAGA